jgi:hypothetical protein
VERLASLIERYLVKLIVKILTDIFAPSPDVPAARPAIVGTRLEAIQGSDMLSAFFSFSPVKASDKVVRRVLSVAILGVLTLYNVEPGLEGEFEVKDIPNDGSTVTATLSDVDDKGNATPQSVPISFAASLEVPDITPPETPSILGVRLAFTEAPAEATA